MKSLEHSTNRCQHQYQKAQAEISDTFQFYVSLLDEVKAETLKELDDIYNSKMVSLQLMSSKTGDAIEKMSELDILAANGSLNGSNGGSNSGMMVILLFDIN